jgi:hypothetical protein
MKKVLNICISIILLSGFFLAADDVERCMQSIEFSNLFKTVKLLASSEMGGRLSGHEGYNKAAAWAVDLFKQWGIKPVYSDYFRRFNVDYNVITETKLNLLLPGKDSTELLKPLILMEEYLPELFTGFGKAAGEVIFVGYGITAPDQGWDDYGNVDVKGKIVLVLMGYPQIKGKDFSKYWESGRHKTLNAKERGAAAIMRLTDVGGVIGDRYVEGMPIIRLSEKLAPLFFIPSRLTLDEIKMKLNKGEKVVFNTGVKAELTVGGIHYPSAETYDVVGLIEGSDPVLKNEYVMIGAHLDHVGCTPVLFPGAADNASGVAVVMEMARAFTMLEERPKRSIVIVLFAAEERGGGGNNTSILNELPKYPSDIKWMVNFDMVGVGDTNMVAGAVEDSGMFTIVEKAMKDYSIPGSFVAVKNEGMMARSDHTAFLRHHIPSYGNWTNGEDNGYHTDKDTIYKITPQIMEDIARAYFIGIYRFLQK